MAEIITVVHKSGKVVSTSKQLANIFKEAQAAYRERKAELKASKASSERYASPAVSEKHSNASKTSRRSGSPASKRIDAAPARRPSAARGLSDSFTANQSRQPPTRSQTGSDLKFESERARVERQELVRRHSAEDAVAIRAQRLSLYESSSSEEIDMDLAYGEMPGPLPQTRGAEEKELRLKVLSLNRFLEEANCMQHSAQAIIKNLEEDPNAMAAVGLTLAEISSLATKMAPGTLAALKGSFPAVVALLASPQFMIAAGVGVGITIIAFGGYKIIKKISSKPAAVDPSARQIEASPAPAVEQPLEADELEEVTSKIGRIEQWRRGIADAETESVTTSVEGEYVTPGAERHLVAAGVLEPRDKEEKKKHRRRKHAESASRDEKKSSKSSVKEAGASEKRHGSKDDSKSSRRSSRSETKSSTHHPRSSAARYAHEKESSGLKMIFKRAIVA